MSAVGRTTAREDWGYSRSSSRSRKKQSRLSKGLQFIFFWDSVKPILSTMSGLTTQAITKQAPSDDTHPAQGNKSLANRQHHVSNLQRSPLPILLPLPPQKTFLFSYLPTFVSPSTSVEKPCCNGAFDPLTRSVIVTSKTDMDILFRRGFFGKGSLSRSEPTWRDRRLETLRGGGGGSLSLSSDIFE